LDPHQRAPEQRMEHLMLKLGCALPLAMGLAWQLRLWQVLSNDLSDRRWVAFACSVGVGVSLLLAAIIAIAMALAAGLRLLNATKRVRWPWPEVTSLAAVLLALVMGYSFGNYLNDQALWSGASGVFHVERMMAASSLISPAPAIAGLLGLGCAWALWGIRSLHHHVLDSGATPTLIRVLEGRKYGLPSELARGAESTVHPAGALAVLPLIAVGGALLLAAPQTHAVDGVALGWMLTLGSMLGLVGIAIELGQAAWLGQRVTEALEHVRAHALGPIVEDLGSEHADWGISLEPRHGKTRRLLRDKLAGLRRGLMAFHQEIGEATGVTVEIPEPDRRTPPRAPATQPWQREMARLVEIPAADISGVASELRVVVPHSQIDDLLDAPRGQALVRTPLWHTAVSVAEQLATPLEREFWQTRRPIPAYTVPGRFLKDAERFVAIVITMMVRTLVVRVVRGLSISALLGATLLFAHLMYTFPGRRIWLALDLMALTLVAVVSVHQLVVFERDHILNRLWSSQPGRVGLNSGLLLRAIATSALPVLTLLAVLFPEVGAGLLTWMEPLRHLMPMP
jgi:hypothetical protein